LGLFIHLVYLAAAESRVSRFFWLYSLTSS
jgi:hypothetical protein